MVVLLACVLQSYSQMPPPGYERAIKEKQERDKMSILDRDSLTMIDTILIFDPDTYAEEVKVVEHTISIRDYCTTILGMGNPDILLDRQPHTFIDPKTYEDITVRLNERNQIERMKKE